MLGFDELNVLKEIDGLYRYFLSDSKRRYTDLYIARFNQVWESVKGKEPDEDTVDELAALYITGLLKEPNETTHYAFNSETLRKRDKAKEAINSVPTKTLKQIQLAKAMKIWIAQAAFYMDFVSQDAEIEAFKKAGVKKVKRHERKDEKVCEICKRLDGKVYDINKIPELEHLHCRRWFTPV